MSRQRSVVRLVAEPLLIAMALAAAVRAAVSVYSIPSSSMLPALEIGDHILVTPYRWSSPKRGDIIVFRAPSDASQFLVKRIIGLPGDLIDSRASRVRIGEHTISEPYLFKQAATGVISAQLVPADSFFVMGDNREDSLDSRRWGSLSRDMIIGRVRIVLWSSADVDHPAQASTMSHRNRRVATVRLSRIFKCVQ